MVISTVILTPQYSLRPQTDVKERCTGLKDTHLSVSFLLLHGQADRQKDREGIGEGAALCKKKKKTAAC